MVATPKYYKTDDGIWRVKLFHPSNHYFIEGEWLRDTHTMTCMVSSYISSVLEFNSKEEAVVGYNTYVRFKSQQETLRKLEESRNDKEKERLLAESLRRSRDKDFKEDNE